MGRLAVAVVLVLAVAVALGHSRLAWGGPSPTAVRVVHGHTTRLAPDSLPPAEAGQMEAAAALAYAAMRHRFAFGDGRYAASDTRHSWAHLWPFSQALTASLMVGSLADPTAAAARADALRSAAALESYRIGLGYRSVLLPRHARGGNLYYDDNNWIALDLLDVYRLSGRQAFLRRSEGVFRFLVSGWDTRRHDFCPGGVFWGRPPLSQIRTTVSTANAALVAMQLYQATAERNYLAWAQRLYGWVVHCLSGPDGLYYDHLGHHGRVAKQEWTYNQGAMIAVGALLAHATGQQTYLDQAQSTARAALAHYAASGYDGQPPILVAIFFGDLNLMQQVAQLPPYRDALRNYLRSHVRLRPDGHFGSSLIYQAAAVQLYSLAATAG